MKRTSWFFCLGVLLATLGCVDDGRDGDRETTNTEEPQVRWNPMLRNYADNLIVPAYQNAVQSSDELASHSGTLATLCERVGTEQEPAARLQAQQSWRETMAAWQRAELYQLGPLASSNGALRNRIYSYGSTVTLAECAVDQSVVLAQADDFDIASRSYSARGLDALEYLLFDEDLSHSCAPQVTATQGWNELPEPERKAQRCAYAQRIAEDIHSASQMLVHAWQEEGDNYRFEFVHPSYVEDRLKALSDALFYVETHVKDLKVGIPTGLHASCRQQVCIEAAESRYSQNALANIRNNLVEFQRMFLGGEGLGFDDIIIDAGFPQVVEQFVADSELAIAIIDSSDSTLYQQLVDIEQSDDASACPNAAANPKAAGGIPACRLHGALKRITDRLRTDFVAIVNLDLPDRAQSDND